MGKKPRTAVPFSPRIRTTRFRCVPWARSAICIVILFILFHHFSFLPSFRTTVLRPGDFFDPTRHPESDIPSPEIQEAEKAGEGSLHDIRNEHFYLGGTLSLTTAVENNAKTNHPVPVIYDPYPAPNSWAGSRSFKPCRGPRGRQLDRSNPEDMMLVYRGNQKNFPFPTFGSYNAIELDGNVCTDRYARFGAYGYDQDRDESVPGFQRPRRVLWDQVDWGMLQSSCFDRNSARYEPKKAHRPIPPHPLSLGGPDYVSSPQKHSGGSSSSSSGHRKARSAMLIRTVHHMVWTKSKRQYVRSLIMELALHSGAEYEVFLLVDVKDDSLPIYSDSDTIQQLKEKHIPPEFHNMTVFFNTKLLEAWYPRVPEHKPELQHLQAVQIFAQSYPDFDYYWQLEMDVRQVGHMYHFLEKSVEFAKKQPRKYLWERNSYFYTPGTHGSWEEFMEMVDRNMTGKDSVWGPQPVAGVQPIGSRPPVPRPEDDGYKWGVGEEADFITFLPIFDPTHTGWTFPNVIYNFPQGDRTPRRASPVTMSRMSKTLLNLIHHDQAKWGWGLVSEMTALSWSLHHGLKAVSVPHPIYADGQWTSHEAARMFNRGPTENVNGEPDSLWNFDHRFDRILFRLTYNFVSQTAEDLFRRWSGFPVDQNQYTDGENHIDVHGSEWYEGGSLNEDVYGRLCFPPIFLHPIKNSDEEKAPGRLVPI